MLKKETIKTIALYVFIVVSAVMLYHLLVGSKSEKRFLNERIAAGDSIRAYQQRHIEVLQKEKDKSEEREQQYWVRDSVISANYYQLTLNINRIEKRLSTIPARINSIAHSDDLIRAAYDEH